MRIVIYPFQDIIFFLFASENVCLLVLKNSWFFWNFVYCREEFLRGGLCVGEIIRWEAFNWVVNIIYIVIAHYHISFWVLYFFLFASENVKLLVLKYFIGCVIPSSYMKARIYMKIQELVWTPQIKITDRLLLL